MLFSPISRFSLGPSPLLLNPTGNLSKSDFPRKARYRITSFSDDPKGVFLRIVDSAVEGETKQTAWVPCVSIATIKSSESEIPVFPARISTPNQPIRVSQDSRNISSVTLAQGQPLSETAQRSTETEVDDARFVWPRPIQRTN